MQAVSNYSFRSIAFNCKLNGAYIHKLHISDYVLTENVCFILALVKKTKSFLELTAYYQHVR